MTSISEKSNINIKTTNILIVTCNKFKSLIQKELETFVIPIDYYMLELDTLFQAGCARLDIFKYERISQYDTILYLDTDILINSDINVLFTLDLSTEKLYALKEGQIGQGGHGMEFFDFTKYDVNQSAFTSGILLFRNSNTIKELFTTIQLHIDEYIYKGKNKIPGCLDQPFIVYNAISQNKYDNELLCAYAENNPTCMTSDKIVYHFPGGPGNYQSKYDKMTDFLKKNVLCKTDIMKTVNIHEDIWTCSDEMRRDIAEFFKDKTDYTIAEIGAHKGYSTRVLSHLFSKVYAVDNSIEWTAFNKQYNKDRANIEYCMLDIYKDDWSKLPTSIDVSFIDARHTYESCKSDIRNSIKQFTQLKYIIFDDYGVWEGVKRIVDEMIKDNTLVFERFIGLTNVPGPKGIVKNTHEGILCRLTKS